MKARKDMPNRPRPRYYRPPARRPSDRVISFLRHNQILVFLYTRLTDTLVTLVSVVIIAPVGAVLLLFYLPQFYLNWQCRRRYGVEVEDNTTWASAARDENTIKAG
jgi:hypothetical protein